MKKLFSAIFSIAFLLLFGKAFSNETLVPAGLSFDGVDDVVLVPHSDALNQKVITVETWVKVNDFKSRKTGNNDKRQFILFKKNKLDYQNEGFAIYLDDKGKRFWVTVSSKNGIQKHIATEKNTAVSGKWTHLAITADANRVSLYLDGMLAGSAETGFALNFDNEPLFIGDRETPEYSELSYSGHFNGQIDEIRVWDYMRSSAQILVDFNKPLTGQEEGIVLYLPFNEGRGSVSEDLAEGNSAVLINYPKWIETYKDSDLSSIIIFPNPTKSALNIEFHIPVDEFAEINIYSLSGEKLMHVFSGRVTSGYSSIQADISSISNGTYLCELSYGGKKNTFKFIKEM